MVRYYMLLLVWLVVNTILNGVISDFSPHSGLYVCLIFNLILIIPDSKHPINNVLEAVCWSAPVLIAVNLPVPHLPISLALGLMLFLAALVVHKVLPWSKQGLMQLLLDWVGIWAALSAAVLLFRITTLQTEEVRQYFSCALALTMLSFVPIAIRTIIAKSSVP